MYPFQFTPTAQPIPTIQTRNGFVPGIFPTFEDSDKYLSSLDSDTREYVLKHTGDFRTKQDIVNCVSRLHSQVR